MKSPTVLVVEDHLVYQELAQSVCDAAGWSDVRVVSSSQAAQTALRERPADLALIDYTLEGLLTGSDLARWVMAHPDLSRVLCCAWTAYDPSLVDNVFDAVIPKPVAEPEQAKLEVLRAILPVVKDYEQHLARRQHRIVTTKPPEDASPAAAARSDGVPILDMLRRILGG